MLSEDTIKLIINVTLSPKHRFSLSDLYEGIKTQNVVSDTYVEPTKEFKGIMTEVRNQ